MHEERTGTGALYIVLEIFNSMHRPLNGSPLKFRLKKRCLGPDRARHACSYSCKRAERCADAGGCHCRPGYVGPRCDQPVCTPACQNGGVCLAPNKCQCPTGFGGRKCDMEVCHCENGGICMEHGTCRCLPGFIGARCQHHKTGKCELLCKNGGHCNQLNKCTCPSGYTGHLCQRPLCSNGCDAHGKCVAPDQCQCFKGWKGNKCNKTEKMSYADNDESAKRRRKRRKLRQSEEDGQRSKTTSMPGLHVRHWSKHNQSNNKRNSNINNNRRNNNQDSNYRNGFQNKISNNDTFKHDHAFNNPVNKAIKNKQLYLKNYQTNNNKSAGIMRGESFVNHRVKKNQLFKLVSEPDMTTHYVTSHHSRPSQLCMSIQQMLFKGYHNIT
ncbi:hypothetical protein HELRODRAFT_173124 [Helobdella robusta]|uniref:EGF-like domain-containing protein n=1 Tax=Helobdella robusta TaxID=6412 RepID=T1F6E5_HELRO|nr:hypothetical protein HELRODRAFT_173124 [Helobdella robusta]ESO04050.1 hypothetical protein HELRODRAFT_173124 [Helobdella robusta]